MEEAKAMIMGETATAIGFWKVRMMYMYEQGKMVQGVADMEHNKIDILGISLSRWTKSGRVMTSMGEKILNSRRVDDLHQEDIAIIVKKAMDNCLMEWKSVNSMIILANLKGRQTSLLLCNAT